MMNQKKASNYRNGNSSQRDTQVIRGGFVPPQSIELETAVLGIITLNGNWYFEKANDIFTGGNPFYKHEHSVIWETMVRMYNKNYSIDLISLTEFLGNEGNLESIGGPYFLTRLSNDVVSAANFDNYSLVIQEHYLSRETIRLCQETESKAFQNEDVFDILQTLEEKVFELSVGKVSTNYVSAGTAVMDSIKQIEIQRTQPDTLLGVTTGYGHLDRLTNGWQAPDLIILAARPSVGKTAFALNLVLNAAKAGKGVGLFSLEMGTSQIIKRMQSIDSLVKLDHIIKGNVTNEQMEQLYVSAAAIQKLNIQIDDTAGINLYQLKTKARKMVSKQGVELILIDYLQLMQGLSDERSGNRELEVAKISRGLKGLAKTLNVPVIALSQMNRSSDKNGGKNQLSDLRESGSIEQDADIVAFISRPDYQKKDGEIDPALVNKAFIDIKKHRNGKLDELPFETDLSTQRWMEPNFQSFVELPF